MAKDAHNCEGLTCEIAERVTHKDLWWEWVLFQQRKRRHQEWNHKGQREEMIKVCFFWNTEFEFLQSESTFVRTYNHVVSAYEATDYEALADFDPVDPCIDVDRIRAEYCETSHIDVIDHA